jgi:hypothetical protein
MTDSEPVEVTNLDIYGSDPLPWSRARDRLASEAPSPDLAFWLGTTDPDGRAHATGIGAVWHDDHIWFTTGPGARKARNIEADDRCAISVRLTGIDLVLEGRANRVTDSATLEALAAIYRGVGWPAQVEGDAFTAPFSAPSAGPPPWHLYRFTTETGVGVATAEPHGATRWRFA